MTNTASTPPRVRFAPSPTGFFHVGGARTALYNWLFVRRLGGSFVLRIEDTDRERSDESWTDGILNSLTWLGINWDEGPFRQSERRALYESAVQRLVDGKFLYVCDCTRDEIVSRTKENPTPGYDAYCRERDLEPGPGRALRFRVPDEGLTIVHDLIRGDVEFANSTIEDFVVVKSNGDPLFVLANVVDDIDMGITHIIRAEEHLPTTPKAILIWNALGSADLPTFAHVPVLVNEKRQKLSKRRDRVAVEDYRDLGFLPEAMRNYLVLLGWNPNDDRELLTVDEMIAEFRLEDVNRSPAFFDEKRLLHFNGLYLRALSDEQFVERALPFATGPKATWPPERFDLGVFTHVAPLVKERVGTLGEVAGYVEFLFADPFIIDPAAFDKAIVRDDQAMEILTAARSAFSIVKFDHETLREALTEIGDSLGRKLAKTQAPVRVATMGRSVGLPLFESLETLGRDRVLERISEAIALAGS